MTKAKKLTRFERRMIELVVLGMKQTEAVRRLDPKSTRPEIKACKIMARPHVKAALASLEDDALHTAGITRAMIVDELRKIGFANLFDGTGAPKALDNLDEDTRAAVSSIEFGKDGKVSRLRTWSKREALSELAAIAGLKREQVIAPQNIGPGLTVIVQQAIQAHGANTGPSQTYVQVNLPPPA